MCPYCGDASGQTGASINVGSGGPVSEKNIEKSEKLFKEINKAGASGAAEGTQTAITAIGGLGSVFGGLLNIIQPFQPIIEVVGNLFQVLVGSAMKELIPVLMPIIKLLMQLSPIFEVIGTVLGWLIGTVLKGIVWVIYGIARAIAFFVDLFSWLWGAPGGAGRAVDTFFAPILGSYQEGTDNVPRTGPYILHRNEQVTPAGGATNDDIIEELQKINSYNMWKYEQKRRQF